MTTSWPKGKSTQEEKQVVAWNLKIKNSLAVPSSPLPEVGDPTADCVDLCLTYQFKIRVENTNNPYNILIREHLWHSSSLRSTFAETVAGTASVSLAQAMVESGLDWRLITIIYSVSRLKLAI